MRKVTECNDTERMKDVMLASVGFESGRSLELRWECGGSENLGFPGSLSGRGRLYHLERTGGGSVDVERTEQTAFQASRAVWTNTRMDVFLGCVQKGERGGP